MIVCAIFTAELKKDVSYYPLLYIKWTRADPFEDRRCQPSLGYRHWIVSKSRLFHRIVIAAWY